MFSFIKCDTCRTRPDLPLCKGCQHNREVIERLARGYEGERLWANLPPHDSNIHDWAARAATYIAAHERQASVLRLAAIIAHFCKPLEDLLRASKREHYHCDDCYYCCKRCPSPDHDWREIKPEDACSCGAEAWNKRVDAALGGSP